MRSTTSSSQASNATDNGGIGDLPSLKKKNGPLVRILTEETGTTFGVVEDRFLLRELLGEGSFGCVYRCSHERVGSSSGAPTVDYAVKVIDATKLAMLLGYPVELVCPRLRREVEILNHLGSHPRILKLRFAFFSESTNRFYLVTELLTGGELFHAIVRRRKPFSEQDGRTIFAQLVDAVAFCHSMGVAHRDLKLENCLFEDTETLIVKLCDYGQAKILSGEGFSDTAQTLTTVPVYTAPEVASAVEASQSYDAFKADAYGLGVILYGLLCSALPDATKGTSYERHRQWNALTEDARSLIRLLLSPNPAQRPSPADIQEHPWLKPAAPPAERERAASLCTPKSYASVSRSSSFDRGIVDALLATQELIVGLQKERGTSNWALGGEEGESAYQWHIKYTDERINETGQKINKVVSSEELPKPWDVLSKALTVVREGLVGVRKKCQEKLGQRDQMLDLDEDLDEVFGLYSQIICGLITNSHVFMSDLKGGTGIAAPELRLKLLQLVAEQLARERGIVSGRLVRPETFRLAAVVRRLSEVIGARKLLLGSQNSVATIVGGNQGLVGVLRPNDPQLLETSDLATLENVEEQIFMSRKVEKPAVAEWWHNLTKIIDRIHQHIMVGISDFLSNNEPTPAPSER